MADTGQCEFDRELLVRTFLAEVEEICGRMEQGLVALEARPGDDDVLHGLFRDAHTLKGAAGLVAFDAVRDLAHDLEDVLERLRRRTIAVSDALVTLLLRSVDVLRLAVADAAAGKADPPEAVTAFRRRLADTARAAEPAAPGGQGGAPAAQGSAPAGARELGAPRVVRGSRTLRVDVGRLDRMLDLSGEIAVARRRLEEMMERGAAREELVEAHRETDRLYLDLQELIMKARMVPIGPCFHQHVRTVRDVASAKGKQARLVIEGEDAEVDTAIVEQVRDPLMHMVRNAIDHGIERPEERRAKGKDPAGEVVLRAFHDAGSFVIQVSDDGAGLDRKRIAEKAAAMGLLRDAASFTEEDVARVVFEPGLSTSDEVTEISGRGVGMDVVRRNVEALRGSITIESEEGRGTTFTIRVPLTLAIIQGFQVGIGGESYILPLDAVVECLELPAGDDAAGAPFGVLNVRGKPLPYVRLRALFGARGVRPARENVVVIRHAAHVAGVAVDALQGETSTVIKPLGPAFKGVPGLAGASILGNGRVALILDVAGILRETLRRASREPAAAA